MDRERRDLFRRKLSNKKDKSKISHSPPKFTPRTRSPTALFCDGAELEGKAEPRAASTATSALLDKYFMLRCGLRMGWERMWWTKRKSNYLLFLYLALSLLIHGTDDDSFNLDTSF